MVIGKGGYDQNIRQITGLREIRASLFPILVLQTSYHFLQLTVTDGEGRLTAVGAMAYGMCRLGPGCVGEGGKRTLVHIGEQRLSFAIQQAMVVAEVVRCHTHGTTVPGRDGHTQVNSMRVGDCI